MSMLKVFLDTLSRSLNIVNIFQDIVAGSQDMVTGSQDMLSLPRNLLCSLKMANGPWIMLKVSLDIHRGCIDTVSDHHGMVTGSQDMDTGSQDMLTGRQDMLIGSHDILMLPRYCKIPRIMLKVSLDIHRGCIYRVSDPRCMDTGS
jgi:hypothetical protein